MKRDRRHELQENALADWLGKQIEQIKPYWQMIAGAIAATVIVYVSLSLFGGRSRQQVAVAWDGYSAALLKNDVEALSDVATENAGSIVGFCAMQSLGDIHLATGTRALFRDRDQAREELTQARTVYTNLLSQLGTGSDPLLRQRAMFGLAQSHEALDSVVKAIQRYEKLAAEYPDSPIGKAAKERQEELQKPDVRDFCSWFAKQTPRPISRAPSDPSRPPPVDLPDDPDLSLPDEDDLDRPVNPFESLIDRPSPPDDATDDAAEDTSTDNAAEDAPEEQPADTGGEMPEDSAETGDAASADTPDAETTEATPEESTEASTEEEPAASADEADGGDSSETDAATAPPAESP